MAPVRRQLRQACRVIRNGGVVAYPTESCFGLGCYPKNSAAVRQILQMKRRSACKGLIIIAHDFNCFKPYLKVLPQSLIDKMRSSWPAAITWLAPAAHWVPSWLTGNSDKIAIRIPDHRIARELCRVCDHALISTSANKAGQQAIRTKPRIEQVFAQEVDYVVNSACGESYSPSKIIELESGEVIRP